ncbi:Hypothetical Protein FCC1311_051982 [Hondaea fermentalgiana]|uniref:Uncharacterized protein n=1 Tax=Hondaea fermentalgiana TaxID=2315210 RepID=A0A2R5GDF8_9STRA|nr:Hypothetical Protein FCC1311_051982 [Hondaea fermentalgiana]|eukprot:GBG28977.1 Hypothetical Protein FCC1311_051982 [Hondaea fermentalgiana]
MEESVLVENKLRGDWTAPEFVPLLTRERLTFMAKEFSTFELSIRLRVLLSLLSMSVSQLASVADEVDEVLKSAAADSDEWVRVILALVRKRLPASKDVIESASQGEASASETDTKPKEDAVVEEAKKAADKLAKSELANNDQDKAGSLNLFAPTENDPAARFLHEAIRAIALEVETPKTSWPRPGDVESRPRMNPEFVPLEWPFLSSHLLPQDIDIEDHNRHFKPAASEDEVLQRIEKQRLQQQKQLEEENARAPAPPSLDFPPEVPEGMRKILLDPENTKLDDSARQKVIKFYTDKNNPNRPKQGVVAILLNETRTLEGNDMLVTHVNLKLDYATNGAKRATSRKKYKIQ